MPQPNTDNPADRADVDPLLLFTEEPGPAQPQPPDNEKPAEIPALVESPGPAVLLTAEPAAVLELRARLENHEHALKRSVAEVTALKAELATLVSAIKDIQRRVNRKADAAPLPKRAVASSRMGVAATAIGIAMVAAAVIAWQVMVPNPPPIVQDLRPSVEMAPKAPVETAAGTPPTLKTAAIALPLPARDGGGRAVESPRREMFVGTLSIDTQPAGANVLLNRRSVGKTPLRLPNLRAGSHLVWIEHDGYRRWTQVVLVPADKVTRVRAALEADNVLASRP